MFHVFSPSLLVLLGAYALSALLTRGMIRVAVLDTPGHRSSHTRPTPKGGGMGVMGAFGLLYFPLRMLCGLDAFAPEGIAIWGAAMLLATVSWLDDVYQWSPLIKLAAQAVAAVLVTLATLPMGDAGFMLAVTMLCAVTWTVFVTNAVNFMDGLNGLVGGVLCLSFLCLALPFWPADGVDLRGNSALLAFGLLAFLPLNFPHARIFLGDVGSQPCGLLIATAALMLAQSGPVTQALPDLHAAALVPCLIAGLLYDVTVTLMQRTFAGEKLLQAHRGHLYQVAFRAGLPMPTVTLLHWGFVAWGAGAYALLGRLPTLLPLILIVLLPQLVWTAFVVRRVRHHPVGRW
ncbi:UDP-phosphate alpha-N-acetylglucosaminephosphotransferase [Acetobacter estunensis]|uniref:UDP-phosphate alpha-N-acetylglucosaminephosphotransferase n=1 Tax=Acetobacter estunensis TaxID=104097 RepID=UPI001C2D0B11|nr:UDP-phosphate alpha-N-acetylglucosaminephosphotransferase [Acetobacter estunensis]MBV1836977.1 UDP-phosphate alpha-N-acetylglucosaminephosphotransferase [Acetobacter estunensis]